MSPSSTPQPSTPPSKRRRRAVFTCARCQRFKIRCDRARPCGACLQAQAGDQCLYGPCEDTSARSAIDAGPESSSHANPPETKHRNPQRVVKVCTRCKRLKLRCDREQPCGACMKGRRGHKCVYEPLAKKMCSADPAAGVPGEVPDSPHGVRDKQFYAGRASSEGQTTAAEHAALTPTVPTVGDQRINAGGNAYASKDMNVPSRAPVTPYELHDLVSLFPSEANCRHLLRNFFNYDLMFRRVHKATFSRRVDDLLTRLPAVRKDEAPFLAMFAAALQIGQTATKGVCECPDFLPVMQNLLTFCEHNAIFNLDYAHAHLLAIDTQMNGPRASLVGAFLQCGRAYHAAMVVGLHNDQACETMYEREMRRRVWWHIKLNNHLFATRLNIDMSFNHPTVARPLVICDHAIDPIDPVDSCPQADHIPEWAHFDARISFVVDFMTFRNVILTAHERPIIDRLQQCQRMLDDFCAQLRPYLRADTASRSPPWVYAQACITTISKYETAIQLYQPHFQSLDIGGYALTCAVEAALSLISVSQSLTSFLLFEWLDNVAATLWMGGASVFAGGMVLAYSLLSDPANPGAEEQRRALDIAIGCLRSSCQTSGTSPSNAKALETLELLRNAVQEQGTVDGNRVVDPYSGHDVALPGPAVELLGEWVEWDALFRDLFSAQPQRAQMDGDADVS